jgi:hypothetical protein
MGNDCLHGVPAASGILFFILCSCFLAISDSSFGSQPMFWPDAKNQAFREISLI